MCPSHVKLDCRARRSKLAACLFLHKSAGVVTHRSYCKLVRRHFDCNAAADGATHPETTPSRRALTRPIKARTGVYDASMALRPKDNPIMPCRAHHPALSLDHPSCETLQGRIVLGHGSLIPYSCWYPIHVTLPNFLIGSHRSGNGTAQCCWLAPCSSSVKQLCTL